MKLDKAALATLLFGALVGTAGCGARSGLPVGGRDETETAKADDWLVMVLPSDAFRKIDLLFVIDNSISMADKQRLFADAVPVLLKRLVKPLCVDANGNPTGEFSPCPAGAEEFASLDDIHIGIVSSSLGHHGGDVCMVNPSEVPPRQYDDNARLLPSVRTGLYSYQNAGFLVWDPRTPRPVPDPHPGVSIHETDAEALLADFGTHVRSVGERGCGYEGQLEAWYRFLIDPEPVSTMTRDGAASVRGPANALVLEQRARFLRPDSLLAVVMLTDENDCSIIDENGVPGWLVSRFGPMVRASSECAEGGDAAERCCRPCTLEVEGCPANSRDAACQLGPELAPIEDSTNLRCFQQARRFGVDLLYRPERYVAGLTRRFIAPRSVSVDGPTETPNPLYASGADGTRAPDGRAFLVGIVGVPWQDIATEASLDGRGLVYKDWFELDSGQPSRWDLILGDPAEGERPLDPFMVESIDPRMGENPITGDRVTSFSQLERNAINGSEQNVINRDDLQYACTFPLAAPVPCTMENQDGCDCNLSELPYYRPICEYPTFNADGVQTHGKAYPALRQLEVLKGLDEHGVVASICPKNTVADGDPSTDPDYGYNPAVAAMLHRFKDYLAPRCLFRPIPIDEAGQVPCALVEIDLDSREACSCDPSRARFELDRASELAGVLRAKLQEFGWCGPDTPISCDDHCACEVAQFFGDELETCRSLATDPGNLFGFCYIDETNANPELLSECQPGEKRNIRYLGTERPTGSSVAVLFCPPVDVEASD